MNTRSPAISMGQDDGIIMQSSPAATPARPLAESDVCDVDVSCPADTSDTSDVTLVPSLSANLETTADNTSSIDHESAQLEDLDISFSRSSTPSIAKLIEPTHDDEEDQSMGLIPLETRPVQSDEKPDEDLGIVDDPALAHGIAVDEPPEFIAEDHDLVQHQIKSPEDICGEPAHALEASAEPTLMLVDDDAIWATPKVRSLSSGGAESVELALIPVDMPILSKGTPFILNHDLMKSLIVQLNLQSAALDVASSNSRASNQIAADQEIHPEDSVETSLPRPKEQESIPKTVGSIETNPSPLFKSYMLHTENSETSPSSNAQSSEHIKLCSEDDRALVDLKIIVPVASIPEDIIIGSDLPVPVESETDAVTSTKSVAIQVTEGPEKSNGRIFNQIIETHLELEN